MSASVEAYRRRAEAALRRAAQATDLTAQDLAIEEALYWHQRVLDALRPPAHRPDEAPAPATHEIKVTPG